MQRIEFSVDKHDAIFPRHAVGSARVEKFDGEKGTARQFMNGRGKCRRILHAHKILSGMKARRTKKEREPKAGSLEQVGCVHRFQCGTRQQHRTRYVDIAQSRQPSGVRFAAGFADEVRRVERRRAASVDDLCHRIENAAAKIGIADSVEDDVMRGEDRRRVDIFRVDGRHRKNAVIEDHIRRDIAASRRHNEQDAERNARTAIRPHHDAVAGETLFAMPCGAFRVALFLQHACETLMRVNQARIDRERLFIKLLRRFGVAVFEENVSEIDEAERIVGVAIDSLAIGGNGRGAIAGRKRQTAKIGQRAEMRRVPLQDRHKSRFRVIVASQPRQDLRFGEQCFNGMRFDLETFQNISQLNF